MTPKERAAMQQALEALEEINKLSIGENAICLPAEIDDAMEALRQALAEPPTDNQIMFKRLDAYEFAINEYEQALKAAFPRGATGDAFHHWNAARKYAGRPYLSYEQKERPEMDEDMREMQQEIDSLLKANMELQADAEAWRNFKAKTLIIGAKK